MCTREEVRTEVRNELGKALPGPLTKAIVSAILIVVIGVFGWIVRSEIEQGKAIQKLLHHSETQKEFSITITEMLKELHALKVWQSVHDQYMTDKEQDFKDRFSDLHKLIDNLNRLINAKSSDRWTGKDATARNKFVDYRYEVRVKEVEKRFEQCAKRLDWLELQAGKN
jgi:hypothetical protein